ncbi:putative phosphatidate phosphatase [Cimex lectularius]|uniref:Phosphatidic acid phosphatase type 2/haloperoxidase domain-containing protein n=1 Tax=Cimex lectularius TaxID=79782 RepID=A0A8I6RN67_CIMLE|nr:putative phosphatidate phosphatase [Cimex lectularius]
MFGEKMSVRTYRVIGDGVCAVVVLMFALTLMSKNVLDPFQRGFFCEDASIKYPVKPVTTSKWTIFTITFIFPLLLLMTYEIILYYCKHRRFNIQMMYNVYNQEVVYIFGLCLSLSFNCMIKLMIGRLRPTFYEACGTGIDCNSPDNRYVYLTNFTCSMASKQRVWELRQSFPSSSSTAVTLAMVYISLFIEAKLGWKGMHLAKRAIQMLLISIAIFIAITKVSDYTNHWSDVLVGMAIGAVSAFFMGFFMSDMFEPEERPLDSDISLR